MQKDKPHRLIERWEQERGATEALGRLRHTAVFHKDFHSLWKNSHPKVHIDRPFV